MTKLSKCCKAKVAIGGEGMMTPYHVCTSCFNQTDLYTKNAPVSTPVDTNNPEEESQDIMKSTMPRSGQAWDIASGVKSSGMMMSTDMTTDLKELYDKAFAAGQKFERESIKAEFDKLLN